MIRIISDMERLIGARNMPGYLTDRWRLEIWHVGPRLFAVGFHEMSTDLLMVDEEFQCIEQAKKYANRLIDKIREGACRA